MPEAGCPFCHVPPDRFVILKGKKNTGKDYGILKKVVVVGGVSIGKIKRQSKV